MIVRVQISLYTPYHRGLMVRCGAVNATDEGSNPSDGAIIDGSSNGRKLRFERRQCKFESYSVSHSEEKICTVKKCIVLFSWIL